MIGRALSFDHDERVVVRGALDGHHLAVPPGADAVSLSRALAGFHDEFLATGRIAPTVRPVVADSWRRSLVGGLDPETGGVRVALGPAALEELRRRSPLARTMPVIRRLLVDAAADAGLVVAVSDAAGQLLWVEGDAGLRTRAEAMQFVPGADWSEASAGTNAPGTALRTGRGVQILGPEHLMRLVTPWSCTAVPIRDPDTRSVLGALDVTGGAEAAGAQTLALVRATVAAAAALALVLLVATPALAHASLVGETPAAGSTVRTPPGTVGFRFDENIRQPSVVIVTAPDGTRVDHGPTSVLDNTASVAVTMTERGRYTMSYRVISADGHPVTSQTRFDYQGPVSAAPTSSGTEQAGSGSSSSPAFGPGSARWVVLGVLVVLAAAGALLLGRRRQPPASDTDEDPGTTADQPRRPV